MIRYRHLALSEGGMSREKRQVVPSRHNPIIAQSPHKGRGRNNGSGALDLSSF